MKDMKNLRSAFPLLFLLFILSGCAPASSSGVDDKRIHAKQPNVLFIMADDLGWADVGFMGGRFFETPHIDQLAGEGISFRRCYAGAANCAPSRACLMSGQNTPRHGIYTVSPSARGKSETRKLIPTPNTRDLADEFYTIPEFFRDAGYATATFGKWHLGPDPKSQGFDVNVAGSRRGNPGRNGYFSPYKVDNLSDGPAGEHLTDRLTSEAISFLQHNHQRPFFLYLPYYSVHTPILAKDSLKAKYAAKAGNTKDVNTVYAAMVETLDHNVGRLLHVLDSLGLRENTLVVFTSDNGGIRSIATQDPLRAGKGSYYEGGLRVPCIIRWPAEIAAGQSTDTPVCNLDFYPTFLEVLNLPEPDWQLDGTSLRPLWQGATLPARPFFWHFPIYLQAYNPEEDDGRDPLFRTRPGSVIIRDNWKLHQYFEDNGLELYNLATDPGERNNLAETEADKATELLELLENWRNNTGAPVPTELNPEYRPTDRLR